MNINDSTKAKFLCDAILEIQNIIEKLGGNKETFLTYAGIGDFILTSTNIESRNYTFGKLIGENQDIDSYLKKTTVEGLENLENIYIFLQNHHITSPIINILFDIIYLHKDKNLIVKYLLNNQ